MSALSTVSRNPVNLQERLPAWRARLEEERTFLLAQSRIMAAEREAFPTLADNQVTVALVAATDAALVDVDDALARMDIGDYGSCLACQRAIPPDRLDVLPVTPRCRSCQRALPPGHATSSTNHGAGARRADDSRPHQPRRERVRHTKLRNQR